MDRRSRFPFFFVCLFFKKLGDNSHEDNNMAESKASSSKRTTMCNGTHIHIHTTLHPPPPPHLSSSLQEWVFLVKINPNWLNRIIMGLLEKGWNWIGGQNRGRLWQIRDVGKNLSSFPLHLFPSCLSHCHIYCALPWAPRLKKKKSFDVGEPQSEGRRRWRYLWHSKRVFTFLSTQPFPSST